MNRKEMKKLSKNEDLLTIEDFKKYGLTKQETRLVQELSNKGKKIMMKLLDLNQAESGTKTSWILAAIIKYEWFGNAEIDDFIDLVKEYFQLDTADQEIFKDMIGAYIDLLPEAD